MYYEYNRIKCNIKYLCNSFLLHLLIGSFIHIHIANAHAGQQHLVSAGQIVTSISGLLCIIISHLWIV